MDSHYIALILAYASVAGLWFLIYRIVGKPWDKETFISFQKPWLEFIYAILTIITILGIGQLYVRGMLIPNNANNYIDSLNQILIFSHFITYCNKKTIYSNNLVADIKYSYPNSLGISPRHNFIIYLLAY